VSTMGFWLTHLFFADDSRLFCRANFQEWGNVMKLLQRYEQASSQKLNSAKIAIYFSKNTGKEFQRFIASSVGISTTKGYEKYLDRSIVGCRNG
jgi:hypothetical protein